MKKIMKNATVVALSAAMLASTAVCVSAEETKDVSITVFHYMTQTSKQAGLDAVEAAFAEAHPEYNITWDNVFYNQGTDFFPAICHVFYSIILLYLFNLFSSADT